uniref:ribosome maturation factor RimM n=1 Tax=uncultured Draconibacterium sp. TaxID=1573823 RepID=UPI0032179239
METIPKADCEKIGYFRKTHGVQGDVVLEYEPQFEYSIEETDHFFIELEGLLVPFFIAKNGFRFTTAKSAIVSFDWVDTEKYAKRLVGSSVYLFKSDIIDEPDESESMLEGFLLIDEQLGEIGMINQVDDYSGNIVLTVNYRGNEILVPYNDDIAVSMDETLKTITLKLPDGILDD